MPSLAIQPGATVFVTGVNGLIGSYVVDELLGRGYNVRGAVRDVKKCAWLKDYFDDKLQGKNRMGNLELVEVPDMTVDGCYDGFVEGVEGFIHVASPVGTITDLQVALDLGRNSGLNALSACAKTPSVKRFVNTSSAYGASWPRPHDEHEYMIGKDTYNDEALEIAKQEGPRKNIAIYCAMKGESEKAMCKCVEENKPGFEFNCVLPYANFGPVLVPEHQGYPSTIAWAHAAWTGEYFEQLVQAIPSQWFISIRDAALLHISALVHEDVKSERLFGYAERWNYNQILAILRKNFPGREFPEDVEGLGDDMVRAPTERAEEVLKWIKGSAWDGMEESVVAMAKKWE